MHLEHSNTADCLQISALQHIRPGSFGGTFQGVAYRAASLSSFSISAAIVLGGSLVGLKIEDVFVDQIGVQSVGTKFGFLQAKAQPIEAREFRDSAKPKVALDT
jgi:hypothetical protein